MKNHAQSFGYYHAIISRQGPGRLLKSNNERAYVLSQLQDLLSPRLFVVEVPAYKQLASCIDLLTFSIRDSGIDLVLFAIDKNIATSFINHLTHRLTQYQAEYHPHFDNKKLRYTSTRLRTLIGAHQALATSVVVHLLHDDWEYDRYSSIGFYLHDRRGDWMRTWRLAQLYENNAEHYRSLIMHASKPITEKPLTNLRLAS